MSPQDGVTAPDAPDAPRDLLDEVDEWLSSHSHTREAEPTLQLYRCADWLFRLVQRVRTAEVERDRYAEDLRLINTLTRESLGASRPGEHQP